MNRNEPIDQHLLNALCGSGPLGRDSLMELELPRNGRGTTPSTGRPYEMSDEDWVGVEETQETAVVLPTTDPTTEGVPIDFLVATMWS